MGKDYVEIIKPRIPPEKLRWMCVLGNDIITNKKTSRKLTEILSFADSLGYNSGEISRIENRRGISAAILLNNNDALIPKARIISIMNLDKPGEVDYYCIEYPDIKRKN